MKKVLSAFAAAAILAASVSCGSSDGNNSDKKSSDSEKITLNVMTFTNEVPEMINKYMELNPEFGKKYKINPTVIATTDGLYQPALDQALSDSENAPDIYCAEAAFVLKYTQGDACGYAAPYNQFIPDVDEKVKSAEIAQYTVDIGTNPQGNIVGLGYQSTGGAFIYRRSIAREVFGTDEPQAVQKEIGPGWDKFFKAAEELKKAGYGIVSGDGDIWHAVENSSDTGWIVNGELNIDKKREEFFDISKKLKDNKYHNDTQDWTEAWYSDMAGTGEKPIFGFFGPAWLINYTMAGNSGGNSTGSGTYGDWAVCDSPVGFFWGGTWLLANKKSEHKEAIGELFEWITLNTTEDGLQYMWANGLMSENGTKDAVASNVVMKMSDGSVDFLGGQNMFDIFIPASKYANGKNLTQYDETINNYWRDQVRQYTSGQKSKDEAIEAFRQKVADNLSVTVK